MDLLKRIKDRAPEYDAFFDDLISKFTVLQGGRAGFASESTTWQQGKYFTTKYEIYMYAVLLGLKTNSSLPFKSHDKIRFIEIKSWIPHDLADYIIMAVLSRINVDFIDLENKDDNEIEKFITYVKKSMEEFANGGFEIIRTQIEKNPSLFEDNDNCFIDLLDYSVSATDLPSIIRSVVN